MGYVFKYTATRTTWGGSVNAGESFTIVQSSSGSSGQHLVNHLRKIGREVKVSTSIGGGALKVCESRKVNEWQCMSALV